MHVYEVGCVSVGWYVGVTVFVCLIWICHWLSLCVLFVSFKGKGLFSHDQCPVEIENARLSLPFFYDPLCACVCVQERERHFDQKLFPLVWRPAVRLSSLLHWRQATEKWSDIHENMLICHFSVHLWCMCVCTCRECMSVWLRRDLNVKCFER